MGRSHILFDHGAGGAHAAPLSFEMNYGKDRVLVNCGSHDSNKDWRDLLLDAAAHNTLQIDGYSAAKGYKTFDVQAQHTPEYSYVQSAHDGYLADTGLIHRRSLYLSHDGHDLRGEDNLYAQIPLVQDKHAFERFHLHPKIVVSIVQDGAAALLRLPNGIGWRFKQQGGHLSLQDSIYAGELGTQPRKAQQLVIAAAVRGESSAIKWALQREGV